MNPMKKVLFFFLCSLVSLGVFAQENHPYRRGDFCR